MEISKENIFEVKYTSVLGQDLINKKKNKLRNFICKNKLITATIIIFIMCTTLNFFLIFNFIKILENI